MLRAVVVFGIALVVVAVIAAVSFGRPRASALPRLAYYTSEIGRYRLWILTADKRADWVEARKFVGNELSLANGAVVALSTVQAYAVTYPSGLMVDLEPAIARPFPPGARFPADVRPPVVHTIDRGELELGRSRVDVTFAASGAHADDRSYYTTRLRNDGAQRVRVLRFGGYSPDQSGRYQLSTITGGFFTGADFREWYAVPDRDGWLAPGGVVSDPNNYGGRDVIWAYEFEAEDGTRFWTGGSPWQ